MQRSKIRASKKPNLLEMAFGSKVNCPCRPCEDCGLWEGIQLHENCLWCHHKYHQNSQCWNWKRSISAKVCLRTFLVRPFMWLIDAILHTNFDICPSSSRESRLTDWGYVLVAVDVKNVRFIQTGQVFVSLCHVSEKYTPFLIIEVKWGFAVLGIEEVELHAIKTSKMEVN